MAAAGSSDFQVERESNRVFVKPVKSGVSTDLFVWTASRRFAYELETTEEVKKMNFAIDNASPEIPRPVPTLDADQLADVVLTRALLGVEEIKPLHSHTPKKKVSMLVDQVFRTRSTVYVHYNFANGTHRTFHLTQPQARQLQPDPSLFSAPDFLHMQLDGQIIDKITGGKGLPLPVAHSESESMDLQPGERTQGVLAIRRDLKSPAVIEIVFEDGLKAVVVL
jgi:hypothetical protein